MQQDKDRCSLDLIQKAQVQNARVINTKFLFEMFTVREPKPIFSILNLLQLF